MEHRTEPVDLEALLGRVEPKRAGVRGRRHPFTSAMCANTGSGRTVRGLLARRLLSWARALMAGARVWSRLRAASTLPAVAADREADVRLVRAMCGPDAKSALGELYDRYSGIVMAVIMRILGSRAEAEELLQEVFIELWRRAPDYDANRGAVTTWVITIARSRALDALRARKRRGGDRHVAVDDTPMPAPSHQRPDEKASLSQRGQAVRTALDALSEPQRTALELSYFEGLSHREIAERLQIPVGTVKSRIISAMKVLRGALVAVAP